MHALTLFAAIVIGLLLINMAFIVLLDARSIVGYLRHAVTRFLFSIGVLPARRTDA